MDFGKVSPQILNRIAFSLPPDHAPSLERLVKTPGSSTAKIFVGAPVWSCKEWVGKIYPPKTQAKDFLFHYSRQFNSIELNSSFYRIPDAATVRSWLEKVPAEFRFFPKVPQTISHSPNPREIRDQIARFVESVLAMGQNLGTCFLQLPPHFSPAHLGVLKTLLSLFSRDIRMAVEFRHPDWFSSGRLIEPALDALVAARAATVITDVAGRRDVLHTCLTEPSVMVRFVGNELHPSDFSRIEEWSRKLKAWLEAGLRELDFFIHHPGYENVPELSSAFVRNLNAALDLSGDARIKDWTPPQPEPEQMSLI